MRYNDLNMATKPELFGTDGIRGVAGQYPLDRVHGSQIGSALGTVLKNSSTPVRVVLGKDTRESNEWISRALASGLAATGAEVLDAGIITTPGVAFLTRQHEFSAGVMVSASHNPYQDNGIKIFSSAGTKLAEAAGIGDREPDQDHAGLAGPRRKMPRKLFPAGWMNMLNTW